MTLKRLNAKQLQRVLRAAVFGFTTVDAEKDFCGETRSVAAGSLGALVNDGYLESFDLDRNLKGFRITAAGVTTLGLRDDIRVRIGGVQAALPRLAALYDCARRNPPVLPLIMIRGDVREATSTDYLLVPGESRPVALIMIDAGGNPKRVRFKVGEKFAAAKADPHLGPVVRRGDFTIRLLTPAAGKAQALAKEFSERTLVCALEIDVVEEMQRWLL